MIPTTIVGASGYGGGELARLLDRHPSFEVVQVLSNTFLNKPFAQAFNGMYGTKTGALSCGSTTDEPVGDLVFLAQESGFAMKVVQRYLDMGRKVIDLSADFRLRDPAIYRAFYKAEPASQKLLNMAVYGMPELYRTEVKGAQLVANPGCYVTATTLALKPCLDAGIVMHQGIIVDAKSGISGAGRSSSDTMYKYAEANESTKAYAVGGHHRHTPEIEQNIAAKILFTPHLVPMSRGILVTCYAQSKGNVSLVDVHNIFVRAYANEPFITIRPIGEFPSTKDVTGTNRVHIGVGLDTRSGVVILVSVIDNLMKGAAGQAVQNANLMFDLPETDGLNGGGVWP